MTPTLSAILVSYNTRDLTLRALAALTVAAAALDVEIWVADNASSDDSVAQIRARFPDVVVLECGENLGFGAANNLLMERARGEFFLLLNTDAFLEADALRELLEAAARHPRAGVLAPRVLNADGSHQKSVWPFPTPARAWIDQSGAGWLARRAVPALRQNGSPAAETEIPWAIGACLLVRRAAYQAVGGFDPRFWMYAEETDWQLRMRAAGWSVVFAPAARVTHLGGASGAGEAKVSEAFFRSMDLYTLKHGGRAALVSLRAAMALGNGLRLPFFGVRALLKPHDARAQGKLKLARWLVRRQLKRLK